jgi:hypothetical protein
VPGVFGGLIINYLFTPYSTKGRASGTPKMGFFTKSLKTIKSVTFKKYASSKKDF